MVNANQLPQHQADIQNGAYIFAIGGCKSCHSEKDSPADAPLKGGRALNTPFGIFYTPNISPDPVAGIGNWSNLDFINAMIKGVSPGKSHYYPSFPYTSYKNMTLTDLIDLKAYIDTLAPSSEPSKAHDLKFPFSIRRGLGLWKILFSKSKTITPETNDKNILRGAYLVEGPGHCGECHTPRNLLGGTIPSEAYAGAPDPEGKGFVPNITPHENGIGNWSVEDIAYALETGFTPEFDSLGGSMADVIENTSKLNSEDRLAIAQYLKSLPAKPTPKR
jgi:mono/diheme cytochrome c family protein